MHGHPVRSLAEVLEVARAAPQRPLLACAAADDEALLEGVDAAASNGIVESVLIGDARRIERFAGHLGLKLPGVRVEHEPDPRIACQRAVDLCRSGEAQVLMKGRVTTAALLVVVLDSERGLRRAGTLSHVTVFEPFGPGRLMVLADAGVNIAPDLRRKLDIVRNSVELAMLLGVESPRVAMLAAVEQVKKDMPATLDAAEIAGMAHEGLLSQARIGGPYSLDVAVSADAARQKGIVDDVAGRADVLVAPDIEAGNLLYKSLTCFARLDLASLVLGAYVPLVVPSRADSARTKLSSIALAVVAANRRAAARSSQCVRGVSP
jgi:phosphate butyryltransferase